MWDLMRKTLPGPLGLYAWLISTRWMRNNGARGPIGVTVASIVNEQILDQVNNSIRDKILKFAQEFGDIKITSGRRTIKEQAEIMAKMKNPDLDLYGKGGYVAEIKKLEMGTNGRDVEKVQKILNKYLKKGSFISRHLKGQAVDISMKYGSFNLGRAKSIAKKRGLKYKVENSRNCFHMQFVPDGTREKQGEK